MVQTDPPAGQVLAKQQVISDFLRQRIVTGELQPGGRLPTQVKLVEQFQVSGVTIQRALDRLMRDGFIQTRGRHGTFVTQHPPHLFSYGLVFGDKPEPGEHRSRYHEMLESQALRLERVGDRKVTVFNGISGREDSEASRHLVSLVKAHQMAGLMLVDADHMFPGTPLLDEPGMCRVAIMSRQVATLNCPIVFPNMAGMIDAALNTLVARGRKKIAVLITVPVYQEFGEYLRRGITAHRITTHEHWLQIVPHEISDAVRNTVLMMMRSAGPDRPDGLFIADDNIAEGASLGLIAAGISVPQDIEVVAHCNFPWLAPTVLPMQRIGFDTQEILEAAVKIIDQQRHDGSVSMVTPIQPVLENGGRLTRPSIQVKAS